ncbi:MAG: type II secretion system F family protein [Eubacteriales bacterium]|nr:type II secretion system F family protein [Eubacteriales bacterium]
MRRKGNGKQKNGPLHRPAAWLWALQERYRGQRSDGNAVGQKGLETLCRIWGPAAGRERYREFQIRKREKLLAVFLVGMGLAAALGIRGLREGKEAVEALTRPESGLGDASLVLEARVGDEDTGPLVVTVPEQRLSKSQCEEVLLRAQRELEEWMASQPDWDAVSEDLSLPVSFCGGLAEGVWQSSSYDLMDASGRIRKDPVEEDGELLVLTVRLVCGEAQRELAFPLRIVPEGQTAADRLQRQTKRQMLAVREEEGTSARLPEELDGQTVTWTDSRKPYGLWIALLTVAGCVLLNFAGERDLEKEGLQRQDLLLAAYPSFLARLTLLAQTGMPVRQIFARLAQEGAKAGASPVYEEVLRTFREMESGTTQLEAFVNFGKRTRLAQYKKCMSLLAQNVRKGTGELLTALGQEAENAFEERKAAARRKGEEAQTKLLLPMLMMLGVVMILILVPACFSFGGM